jgi:endoglucanase
LGVVLVDAYDVGGGQGVGYLDTGDWMVYPAVTIPITGTYTVSYRVSGYGGNLQLERAGGTPVFGTVVIPNCGGWQNWQTVSHTVNLSAGSLPLGIKVTGGGWNINWFTITSGGSVKLRVQLEGRDHLHMKEVQVFDKNGHNVALNKVATQSSIATYPDNVFHPASKAVNGDLSDGSLTNWEAGK